VEKETLVYLDREHKYAQGIDLIGEL